MGVITFGRIIQSGSGWVKGVFKLTDERLSWNNPIDGKEKKIQPSDITAAKWVGLHSGCILKLELRGGASLQYTGFKSQDFKTFSTHFSEHFSVDIAAEAVESAGHNWGNLSVDNNSLTFSGTSGKQAFEVSMFDIAQCAVPNNDEVEIQFAEENTENVETVVSMRLFIPRGATVAGMAGGGADGEDGDDVVTSAQEFQQQIVERCGLGTNTGDVLVEFDEKLGSFLTPRGRYKIEMFSKELRMHGKTYDYTIQYKHISRLYLLPKKTDLFAFVISLSVPIRQGAQRYAHLIMQLSTKDHLAQVNLTKEEIGERYGHGALGPETSGQLHKVMAKVFRTLTGKKIYTTGTFKNYRGDKAIKCSFKSNEGLLFPLTKSFFFIHKPPTFIPFDSIIFVEFARYQTTGGMQSRTFDLQVVCKSPDGRSERDITFQGMGRNEYTALFNFLSNKKINIRNITSGKEAAAAAGAAGLDGEFSDSENDSDYSGGGPSSSSDGDYDEDENEEDSEDSDEGEKKRSKGKKKRSKEEAGKKKKKKIRSK